MGPLIVHSIAFRREYMLIVRIALGASHQLLGSDVIDLTVSPSAGLVQRRLTPIDIIFYIVLGRKDGL